ncbi:MAG: single-stranded DNA-binding protein, partial [Oscillospiraceae bacterium]
DGSIQTGSYDDKETGKKRYTFEVVANNVSFGESKAAAGGSAYNPNNNAAAPRAAETQAPAAFAAGSADDFAEIDDSG